MNLLKTRRRIILFIALAVLFAAAVYAVVASDIGDPYAGLTLTKEVVISAEDQALVEQRIVVTEAAIKVQEGTDDLDWDLYLVLAHDYKLLGDLVSAREAYETYFELNPLNYAVWNTYGNVLRSMGDIKGAEAAYAEALRLNRTEEFLRDYISLLDQYYPDGERDDDIERALLNHVQEDGQTLWSMVTLGDFYFARGQCTKAIDHYEVAQQLETENALISEDLAAMRAACSNE